MYILGISSYYHDSAAVIIKDGKIIAAFEEERFSRIKHDNNFPTKAIAYCLKEAKISISDINYVSYYEKPLLKFERILTNYVQTYPFSIQQFTKSISSWLSEKIKVGYMIRKKLGYSGKIYYVPHHLSHAAASYYTSPFGKAAIATIDGVGEYQTTCLWEGNKEKIRLIKNIEFPHSLGLLYSTFTSFLGFRVNEGEYKVMGLAAYGMPNLVEKIYKLLDVNPDGSFMLNMNYFAFTKGSAMFSKKFEELFGTKREPDAPITKRHKDIAASIQKVTEDMYQGVINHLYSETNNKNVCVGGGVALNSVANGKIYHTTKFKKVHIFGPAGDSGAAIGSALFTYHSILGNPRKIQSQNLCLGSHYSDNAIEITLNQKKLLYKKFKNDNELIKQTTLLLSRNKVVGWFQDRMEFGPRALGSRSILANPRMRATTEKVNKVKIREQFRPFAAAVLQNNVHEFFEVPDKNHYSPYMTFCFQVKKEKVNQLPAVVHKDGTCRIQTISEENGMFYLLLKNFYKKTGIPCLLNTSFNLKNEPIVESPDQAIIDFTNSEIDHLVIGNFIISKEEYKSGTL